MPRRMRSSFGCVQRVDRERYRLRWWEEAGGEYKRRSETVRGTRREAERRMAEIRASLDETAHGRRREVPTVREAYERWWLPDAEQALADGRLARSSMKCRLSKWRKYVGPRWGDVRVNAIDPLELQEWLLTMTRKPASDALALLRQVLDRCLTYDVVDANVARRPYRMPTAQVDRSDGAYTLAELARIAEAARGSFAEAPMLLCMFGSARTGEALGVGVSDVEAAESHGVSMAVAHVSRQVTSDARVSARLKNRSSVRALVVPEPWGPRLLELAAEAGGRGEAWLAGDGTGRPLSQNAYRREWARVCRLAGVGPRQPRAARRSWETYMRWDMGVEQWRVEQMMGHALPGVTGVHYDTPTAAAFVEVVGAAFAARPWRG